MTIKENDSYYFYSDYNIVAFLDNKCKTLFYVSFSNILVYMKIIIIGGSVTGLTLANLLGDTHEITIIEDDEERAKDVANKTEALVVFGDGSDISSLKEAGILEADAVIATADDKTNLMICEIAKSENVPRIISLVNEPKNEELFTKLGINNLVSGVGAIVTAIKKLLDGVLSNVRIVNQLGQGDTQIIEVTVGEKSKMIDKKPMMPGAVIAAVYKAGEFVLANENITVEEGDVLLVVVKTDNLASVSKFISGE